VLAGVVVAAAVAAYHDSFSGPFVFDGESSVVSNLTIRHLWPLDGPLQPPVDGSPVSGRPLVNLTLAFNYAVGGLDPRGYHVLNLFLHVSAGLLLFGIVRRTLLLTANSRIQSFSNAPDEPALIAAMAATLWVVHPLQTEAVTYVAQRAESMMGLFYFLTVYGFVRMVGAGAPRGRRLWFSLSILASFLGMASKEVMASAPVIVLLYDRTFVAGSFGDAWRRRRLYYLALGSSWIVLAHLMVRTGNRAGTVGFHTSVPWWEYATNQGPAILHYLRLAVWPSPLVIDYGPTWSWPADGRWAGCIVVGLLVAATALGLKRRSPAGFLGCWFFAILAPTSSVIPVATEIVAEHRMYLPLAALAVLAALGLHRYARNLAPALACLLTAGLVLVTVRRNEDYRSDLALWRQTVGQAPANAGAHNNLGLALAQAGDRAGALREFAEAVRLNPRMPGALGNRGMVLAAAGRLPEAVTAYQAALAINPDLEHVHGNLGRAWLKLGRMTEAVAEFRAAVLLNPGASPRHNELGLALEQAGRPTEAAAEFAEAVRLQPDFADARYNLGNILAQQGRLAEAIAQYEAVLRLSPENADAQTNLGSALLQSRRIGESIGHFNSALRLNPRSVEARMNLGSALTLSGRSAEAVAQFEAALRLEPDNGTAHYNLAVILSRLERTDEAEIHFAAARRLGVDR
jgi:tetratricopeptide (TPR) repeat protein